jgi:DNA polymerase-4
VANVLDRHGELTHIRSVDKFQLALSGAARELDGAAELVARLKRAVASDVGACLRFSAGIGPNHLLAKIAGKLEKPDGFRWLSPDNMPGAIAHLALNDLPGIPHAMKDRLYRTGVYDVETLYRLDPRHARLIWRSVEGERFVRLLQGMDIPLLRPCGAALATRRCWRRSSAHLGRPIASAADWWRPPRRDCAARGLLLPGSACLSGFLKAAGGLAP